MSNSQLKTIETYIGLMNTNGAAHVLRTAIRLGIVDALMDGQKTVEQLAEACSLQPQPLEWLLAVTCQTGLIEHYGDDYALSQVGRMLPTEFRDLGDRYWQYLEGYVRTGRRIPDDVEIPQHDGDYLAEAASSEWIVTPAALEAIQILDIPESRSGKHILEIGAGSAVFGLAILHHDPTSNLTALDTEQNLGRTTRTAGSIGKQDIVQFIVGDYRTAELPANQFDLVVIENVLHRETLPTVQKMLQQVHQALRAGGEVAILDVFPGQKEGSLARDLFQLALHMRMSTGTLHAPQTLQAALKATGFSNISFAHLKCPPHIYGVIVAGKS